MWEEEKLKMAAIIWNGKGNQPGTAGLVSRFSISKKKKEGISQFSYHFTDSHKGCLFNFAPGAAPGGARPPLGGDTFAPRCSFRASFINLILRPKTGGWFMSVLHVYGFCRNSPAESVATTATPTRTSRELRRATIFPLKSFRHRRNDKNISAFSFPVKFITVRCSHQCWHSPLRILKAPVLGFSPSIIWQNSEVGAISSPNELFQTLNSVSRSVIKKLLRTRRGAGGGRGATFLISAAELHTRAMEAEEVSTSFTYLESHFKRLNAFVTAERRKGN